MQRRARRGKKDFTSSDQKDYLSEKSWARVCDGTKKVSMLLHVAPWGDKRMGGRGRGEGSASVRWVRPACQSLLLGPELELKAGVEGRREAEISVPQRNETNCGAGAAGCRPKPISTLKNHGGRPGSFFFFLFSSLSFVFPSFRVYPCMGGGTEARPIDKD